MYNRDYNAETITCSSTKQTPIDVLLLIIMDSQDFLLINSRNML